MAENYEGNEDLIPLKDLQKKARQEEAERAKAERKQKRRGEKAQKAAEKADLKSEKDRALWEALKKGKEL